MVVQHNLTAMNANRMLGVTTKSQAKSTEKLSSGYKINRAADDAAGLSISEKMRKQIRGLTQASANAQDGISAVQTAEGALTEVHDMLQRMNELAVKAGNGTNSESDRQAIQDEIDQLITEIDRVSETTKFNETYLLKGEGKIKSSDMVSGKVDGKIVEAEITAAKGNIYTGTLTWADATKMDAGTEDTATITYFDEEGNQKTRDITFETGKDAKTTAANMAEVINSDKELKAIFKASTDEAGALVIESKLDGTQTDDSKNKVDSITFKSSALTTSAARFNKIADDAVVREYATGESYAVQLGKGTPGKDGADAAVTFDLKDGESISVNGKTYTYDAGKANNEANTFKTLDELRKLLGNDYEVDLVFSGTKTTLNYVGNDGSADLVSTTTEEVSTKLKTAGNAKDLTAIDENDFEEQFTTASAALDTDKGNPSVHEIFSDLKVELVITAKATVEQPSDVLNFSLQVGADTTEENKISVDIESMSAKSLGISNVSVTGKDSTNADEAVNKIADAIAKVSSQRSALGAVQNRLEHTINNLDNVVENTTSAESAIRDTDMATEMVKYSNNNILAQAGQSMLAQANQANQGVLSLLG